MRYLHLTWSVCASVMLALGVMAAVQTLGTSLGRPSSIVMGRLLRFGGRISF